MSATREQTPGSSKTRPIVSPADGSVVADVPDTTTADVERAVTRARAGFESWSRTPAAERTRIMRAAAVRIRGERDEIALTLSREMGKPIRQARSEVSSVAELVEYFAEEGLRVTGEIPKLDLANELPIVVKEPVGVVGAITPFNYPIALLTWKLGPALACGCSVVAKPDEHAPSGALRLAELFIDAGLPPEVFQVVTGGAEVGEILVRSPGVDKIAFTGGVVTGRSIGAEAVAHSKRVTLELGGQCPAIVMAGADLNVAIPALVKHTYNNSGQYCYRINRIYVDEQIRSEFVERFVDATSRLVVCDPLDESCDIGPLCHDGILDRSLHHVADARERGGMVTLGGERLTADGYGAGRFMAPTVIDECQQEMAVMREETFGPVVGIMGVSSLAEAIEHANDSTYGLAAYVFTSDSGVGLRAALAVRVGSVWVNRVGKAYPQLPFGGYKASGLGREKSPHGLDEYLELKSVYLGLPDL